MLAHSTDFHMSDTDAKITSKIKRSSIRTRLQQIFIILVFISTILVAIAAFRSIKQGYDTTNAYLPNVLEDRFKANIQREVETIISILSLYTPTTPNQPLTNAQLNTIKEIVHKAKYNLADIKDEGYFFVYDLKGNVIAHGFDPTLESKNLIDLKDPTGVNVIEQLRDTAEKGGGFVTYWWIRPHDVIAKYQKISYVEMIPNTNLWIGTGIYKEDIHKIMAKVTAIQSDTLKILLIKFIILAIILIILSIIISLYFGARLSSPIIKLSKMAKKISAGDYHAKAVVNTDDELQDMAQSLNEMADNINDKMKALEKKEHFTSHLLQSVGDGLMVTDRNGTIIQVNTATEEILGYSQDEFLGHNVIEFIPFEAQKEYKEKVLDNVLKGQTITSHDVTRYRKDGSSVRLTVTVAPVIEEDNTVYYRIHSLKDMTDEYNLRKQVENMENLKKYFPAHVAEKIMENGAINLGFDRKKVTIFFSDLVNFTDLSDNMEAEEIVTILREYFSEMTALIYKNSGTLDKFIGDAVMVFFGAPTSNGIEKDAIQCINMALNMQEKLKELNKKWKLPTEINMRIGINTGYVTVGNIGSENRLEYTVIGTPVNVASRLEHQCTPGKILISHETAQLVKEHFELVEKDALQLKGIHRLIKTFEVIKRV